VWNGAISFGLINIPVKLYSAITPKAVRFNQIDPSNGARIRTRKVNAETGEEVDSAELVKGFEISRNTYVTVSEDELAALSPRATHTIDLEEFVELEQVDPVYFDGAFHVAPSTGAAKPYALLVRALEESGRVAVSRFVMRSKQYVALMRPVDGRLMLSMMVYADELNPAAEIPEFDDLGDVAVTDREVAMAEQLIASLAADFEPEKYHDSYREELMGLIEAKASGVTPVLEAPSAPNDDVVVDLMAALERSVAEARQARGRHPSSGADADTDDSDATGGTDGGGGSGPTAGPRRRRADAGGSTGGSRPSSTAASSAPPAKRATKAAGGSPAGKAPAAKAGAKKPAAKKATKATATKATAAKTTAAKATAAKAPAKRAEATRKSA
jgi:DNA end-binding protein Ku